MRKRLAAALGVLVLSCVAALAHVQDVPQVQGVGIESDRTLATSQQALGRNVGNYRFVDTQGRTITLDQLRGKPLVVSLIYTSCDHICPMITQRLRRAVEEARRVIGTERFEVITVGFDTRVDSPKRMAAYGHAQGVDAPNWRFLSGDEGTVSALARDVGFTYVASAGGYQHIAQTTIVDSRGRVYRQIYGDDFPLQMFIEPLKETVFGTVGAFFNPAGLLDRVRFLCTVYDPNNGRYRISYAIVISLFTGLVSLGGTAFVICRAWLKMKRA